MRSSRPSRIAPRSTSLKLSRSAAFCACEDADVVADRDRLRLDREPGHRPVAPFGEHVVEQHRVDAADHEVAVGMDVVFVRHHAARPCSRSARSRISCAIVPASVPTVLPAQIGERRETRRVGVADAQHLAELVVGQRHRHRRAACGRILDAARCRRRHRRARCSDRWT